MGGGVSQFGVFFFLCSLFSSWEKDSSLGTRIKGRGTNMSCQSTTSYTKILSLNSASFILGRFVSTLCLIFPFFFFL